MTSTFFSNFPTMMYSFDGRNAFLLTDFMRRVSISKEVKENLAFYTKYDILDGETPEMVADKFYQDPGLFWVILTTNEIIDPRYDWCMSQENLVKYCQSKYANIYGVHHYETSTGLVVDSNYPGAASVSNYQFEDRLNEDRRHILILSSDVVSEFVDEFQKEIAK